MNNLITQKLRRSRVPLVLQYEMVECGAASLSMILRYFKKYISLSELRYQCGVSRDGSNMLNIKKAAMHYGLNVKAKKANAEEIVQGKIQFPCLAWWNYNHFLVFFCHIPVIFLLYLFSHCHRNSMDCVDLV